MHISSCKDTAVVAIATMQARMELVPLAALHLQQGSPKPGPRANSALQKFFSGPGQVADLAHCNLLGRDKVQPWYSLGFLEGPSCYIMYRDPCLETPGLQHSSDISILDNLLWGTGTSGRKKKAGRQSLPCPASVETALHTGRD